MWKIRTRTVADVVFVDGGQIAYTVDAEQLDEASKRIHAGTGVLEWIPDVARISTDAPRSVLNVAHIIRITPRQAADDQEAVVQLWYRTDKKVLYLGDPDDVEHVHLLAGLTDNADRNFSGEAWGLLEDGLDLHRDLGVVTVGRPPVTDTRMLLVAEHTLLRGSNLILPAADVERMFPPAARDYIADLLPPPHRRRDSQEEPTG